MLFLGNEMNYESVDAAIAENLESKGNPFCPILNPDIQEKFIDLRVTQSDEEKTPQVAETHPQSSKIWVVNLFCIGMPVVEIYII